MITIIAAIANNNAIGRSNDLPWYVPADLKHFKQLTAGHTVIMGRKTYESIVARLGHSLPDRRSIVVTRQLDYNADGAEVVHSFDDAVQLADGDGFVIGGAELFAAAMALAQKLELTEVDATIEGDVFFPQ
ncbi:MAG TPA: dihydrofolate reductase, partial [Candidatus Saccharimonadales bacterium]|nr:dihydrofolate reductase [Candidatus Saccharimonadales bacterium]